MLELFLRILLVSAAGTVVVLSVLIFYTTIRYEHR